MEEVKPRSIRTVGLLIVSFSAFMIVSNIMGTLAWSIVGIGAEINPYTIEEFNAIGFIMRHYIAMCLFMIVVGILFMIGGIFLRKYRLWAQKFVILLSGLLILLIWTLTIAIAFGIPADQQEGMMFFFFGTLTALFWSTPVGLLIWFLNKPKIKMHFT